MALKYTLKTKRIVIDKDDDTYIDVRGISLNGVVQLLVINRDAMEELFNRFSDRDVEQIGEGEVMEIGMGMIESAPALVAHIIALGADAPDQFDEIVNLPIGVQISALEKIGELTFSSGGGPKKMLALAMKLVPKRQSVTPQV